MGKIRDWKLLLHFKVSEVPGSLRGQLQDVMTVQELENIFCDCDLRNFFDFGVEV